MLEFLVVLNTATLLLVACVFYVVYSQREDMFKDGTRQYNNISSSLNHNRIEIEKNMKNFSDDVTKAIKNAIRYDNKELIHIRLTCKERIFFSTYKLCQSEKEAVHMVLRAFYKWYSTNKVKLDLISFDIDRTTLNNVTNVKELREYVGGILEEDVKVDKFTFTVN